MYIYDLLRVRTMLIESTGSIPLNGTKYFKLATVLGLGSADTVISREGTNADISLPKRSTSSSYIYKNYI